MKVILLLLMIFLHIIDDYNLQGWLASAKQKSYWEQNAPDEMYRYDYIMALFMHSFSWSFMVMIVPIIYTLFIDSRVAHNNLTIGAIITAFCFNLVAHMIVDDEKANRKTINLIQDQIIHLIQIIITWGIFILL